MNVSEGRVTHRADLARNSFGMTGAGVKIGVLSDGVASLAAVQASGDLPPVVNVLAGQAGSGDEGTAMLEIVHDLAPDAQLYFATADPTITAFAANIKALRTAGCDIIVDDVFYFVETPFQRGQTAAVASTTNGGLVVDAVNTVTAAGALYFSSAGNSGNLDDTQSGTWEGDFVDGGDAPAPLAGAGRIHLFTGGSEADTLTVASGPITLYWSDPLGGAADDYDVYILDSSGTSIVGAGNATQSGTQDPYERVDAPAPGSLIVIVKFAGAGRFLHLTTNRGRLSIATAGTTQGHSAGMSPNSFSVAATPAAGAFGAPPNSTGPYPAPFNASNVVELFSSDGPRRIFFNADSSVITPGNVSSTGGLLLAKPDFTAADGVKCATPGFNPFFGTSAAAPHAAAIAALVKSAKAGITNAQIVAAMVSSAIDIEAAGADRDSGAGILDAYSAVQAAGPAPRAVLSAGTVTATEFPGNGNGLIEPGECARLTVQVKNGNATTGATSVSAVLTTSTPGVTIVHGTSAYANIPASSSAVNTTPFQFSLGNTVACPLTIDFTLTVTYTGGPSPEVLNFSLRTGAPPVSASTTLDVTAPTPVAGVFATSTGLQNQRVSRTNNGGTVCGTSKGFPGAIGTGTRRYDAYTFTNCAAAPACVTVEVAQTGGPALELFSAAYLSSFDPANVGTNYKADAGTTTPDMIYSFDVPAGGTFVVVVNEIDSGTSGVTYTLSVDGLCLPCTTYTGTGCCPAIALSPTTLPAGTVGSPYPITALTASGGVAPYTFSVTGLAPGMTATSSSTSVTIAGTPTSAVSGTVVVSGTDSNGCPFSQNFALSVVGLGAVSLAVDVSGGVAANHNKVFEAGENVLVTPGWKNFGASTVNFTGTMTSFTGPAGPVYSIADPSASYGAVAAGATADCGGNCYSLLVTGVRPTAHWDATATETLSAGASKAWPIHIGGSFTDVPVGTSFYRFVETLFHKGITAGCGTSTFCPGTAVTRAQDAVFLLVAEHGTGYTPPPATGVFTDVPVSSPFARFVEQLVTEGVTAGCGGNNFCPNSPVTRAQAAVFLLRTEHGPTYTPPNPVGLFTDVPTSSPFARWVEQLVAEGVTAGCGGGNFCPNDAVTRGQNAVFLTTTFGLNLYGP